MRDFFRHELETLYLKTGLLQHSKLSAMKDAEVQIKMLLDLLVAKCAHFPLIPDSDKQEIIRERMIDDADFQGFNPKILHKWLNAENAKYLPQSQSQFTEDLNHKPAPPEVADKYIEQWREVMAKIGDPQYMTSGIKDQRIQQMKAQFETIECKHISETGQSEYWEFEPGVLTCMACAHKKKKEESSLSEEEQKPTELGQKEG
jgi:hypothetical protein